MRFLAAFFLSLLLLPSSAFAGADDEALAALDRHDYPAALKIWQPRAEKGNVNAEYNLGLMYQLGEGVEKDDEAAMAWYRKAAEKGDKRAQSNLGVLYLTGDKASRDPAEGMKWFRKAAAQGYAEAQYNLGAAYERGEGADLDFTQALDWYRRAAGQGDTKAPFALGLMYDMGEGLAADHAAAMSWFRKAAALKYPLAQAAVALDAAPAPGAAKPLGCSAKPADDNAKLYTYMKSSENDPGIYGVAGNGTYAYLLDEQMNPLSPEELAAHITSAPAFKQAKTVTLDWPYSGWGGAPYARAVEKIIGKPVKGFAGPLWWYPDGAVISSDAAQGTNDGPNQANVASCKSGNGKLHEAAECRAILRTHDNSQALLGNGGFMLTCDDVKRYGEKAKSGDVEANMRLYFFYTLVSLDAARAALYLEKAAFAGFPPADHLLAQALLNAGPSSLPLYRQFLALAAAGGDAAAAKELKNAPDEPAAKTSDAAAETLSVSPVLPMASSPNIPPRLPPASEPRPDPSYQVVLSSPDEEFSQNITVEGLRNVIRAMTKVIAADTQDEPEAFELLVHVGLSPDKDAVVKAAVHYKGDPQKIKPTLETISADLQKLPFPNTVTGPLKFQVIYHIAP